MKQIKKTKFFQVYQKQSDQAQFETHKTEVECKQCIKESVHMCKEDVENKMWTKRGGWSHRGGLRGGAPAGRSLNVSTQDLVGVCLCSSRISGFCGIFRHRTSNRMD